MSPHAANMTVATVIAAGLVVGFFWSRRVRDDERAKTEAMEPMTDADANLFVFDAPTLAEASVARCPICGWQMQCEGPFEAADMLAVHELAKIKAAFEAAS